MLCVHNQGSRGSNVLLAGLSTLYTFVWESAELCLHAPLVVRFMLHFPGTRSRAKSTYFMRCLNGRSRPPIVEEQLARLYGEARMLWVQQQGLRVTNDKMHRPSRIPCALLIDPPEDVRNIVVDYYKGSS